MARSEGDKRLLLQIPRRLYDLMVAHCRVEAPREACGIMTGQAGQVRRLYVLHNVDPDPVRRFMIDPADLHGALAEVRSGRDWFLALWHSHPESIAYPSPRDLALAPGDEHLSVIVSLAQEPPDVRVYRLSGGQVVPVPFRKLSGWAGEWIDLR